MEPLGGPPSKQETSSLFLGWCSQVLLLSDGGVTWARE